jgi:DNA-binding CsgD family transcriptional regulator
MDLSDFADQESGQPRRKLTPEKIGLARKLAAEGLTSWQVAERVGISRNHLLQAGKELNIRFPRRRPANTYPPPRIMRPEVVERIKQMVAAGGTGASIARTLRINEGTVRWKIEQLGLEVKRPPPVQTREARIRRCRTAIKGLGCELLHRIQGRWHALGSLHSWPTLDVMENDLIDGSAPDLAMRKQMESIKFGEAIQECRGDPLARGNGRMMALSPVQAAALATPLPTPQPVPSPALVPPAVLVAVLRRPVLLGRVG